MNASVPNKFVSQGPVFYAALGFGTRDQLILQGGRDSST
jgi:hypothetical protein